jgi:hypothetical protein
MHAHAVLVALALILAPIGVKATDLVVRCDEGVNPEEDAAARETIAAFEQNTGKQVDLEQPTQNDVVEGAGRGFGRGVGLSMSAEWWTQIATSSSSWKPTRIKEILSR